MAQPFLTVTTNDGFLHTFGSHDDVTNWLQSIQKFYHYERFPGFEGNLSRHLPNILNNSVSTHLDSLVSTLSQSSINYNKLLASQEASKLFANKTLIDPTSRIGQEISSLRQKDNVAAFYLTCIYSGIKAAALPNIENMGHATLTASMAKAVIAFAMFEAGIVNGLESIKGDFEGFRKAIETRIAGIIEQSTIDSAEIAEQTKLAIEDLGKLKTSAAEDIASLENQMSALSEAWRNSQTQAAATSKQLEDLINKTDERLITLSETFTADIKTDFAYRYWNAKRYAHAIAAFLMTLFAAPLGYGIYLLVRYVKQNLPVGAFDAVPYWVPFVLLLFVIGTVWFGRIYVRIFMSQMNLLEDAAERAVMAKTYVALVKEGAASPDHMAIVLQALFRASSKGLGADDGSPQLPLEVILKQFSKDK